MWENYFAYRTAKRNCDAMERKNNWRCGLNRLLKITVHDYWNKNILPTARWLINMQSFFRTPCGIAWFSWDLAAQMNNKLPASRADASDWQVEWRCALVMFLAWCKGSIATCCTIEASSRGGKNGATMLQIVFDLSFGGEGKKAFTRAWALEDRL